MVLLQLDDNISMIFDGNVIKVLNSKGEVIYQHSATSGKGRHMNNPNSQNVQNEGPIPEGLYSFNTYAWNAQSPIRQLYNIIRGNGDWGYYNVKLGDGSISSYEYAAYYLEMFCWGVDIFTVPSGEGAVTSVLIRKGMSKLAAKGVSNLAKTAKKM
ncbi:MAG: DUF2778 domain-containing protein [Sphingobacteriales bacterium]|nr:DUF2778 domain-containing protein [Sphingobacteriales bacterium]